MNRTKQKNIVAILSSGCALILVAVIAVITFLPAFAAPGDPDDWHTVGAAGLSAGEIRYSSLKIYNNTPYVAYQDFVNDFKATVKKFNGTAWENVGTAGFSDGVASDVSLAFNGSTPYVVYGDGANGYKATVKKFNGTAWETVGAAGFSAGGTGIASIAVATNGTPYVMYRDQANSSRIAVQKFNGTAWESLGLVSTGFTGTASLAITGTTPYVAFYDNSQGGKATVKRYDGSGWQTVGSSGFSADWVSGLAMQISADGTPYVLYGDGSCSTQATVKKFNGTAWENVGAPCFSSNWFSFSSIALATDGTPYVTYQQSALTTKVMKLSGATWQEFGSLTTSTDNNKGELSLAVNGTTPYLAYRDASQSGKMTVKKFGIADEPVTSVAIPNEEAGSKSIALTTLPGTNITHTESVAANATHADTQYEYPLGLVDFSLTTDADDNEVTLIFVTDLQPNEVVARKYNPLTHGYSAVPGAVITQTSYAAEAALELTYTITDNGELDTDPAIGSITDPVGLAVALPAPSNPTGSGGAAGLPSAPNTGLMLASNPLVMIGIGGGILVVALLIVWRKHSSSKR